VISNNYFSGTVVSNKEKDLGHVLFKHLTLSFIRFHSHEGNVDNFISDGVDNFDAPSTTYEGFVHCRGESPGQEFNIRLSRWLGGQNRENEHANPIHDWNLPLVPFWKVHQSNHARNKAFVAGAAASSLATNNDA
jgi:hypothetical protein